MAHSWGQLFLWGEEPDEQPDGRSRLPSDLSNPRRYEKQLTQLLDENESLRTPLILGDVLKVSTDLQAPHEDDLASQRARYEEQLRELRDENAWLRTRLNGMELLTASLSLEFTGEQAKRCLAGAEDSGSAGDGADLGPAPRAKDSAEDSGSAGAEDSGSAGDGTDLGPASRAAPGVLPGAKPPAASPAQPTEDSDDVSTNPGLAPGAPPSALNTALPAAVSTAPLTERPASRPASGFGMVVADPKKAVAPAPATANPETASGVRWLWVVVGGKDKGGVCVRKGERMDSQTLHPRLCTGAIVEEMRLSGDRLRFHLLAGTGPEQGWISVKAQGRDLAVRADRAPLQPWQPPPGGVGSMNEQPLPTAILFVEKIVPRRLLEDFEDLPGVREMLGKARRILGMDLLKECADNDSAASITLFIAGLASLEWLKGQKPAVVRRASTMAGIGVGQYMALVAAGSLSFEDGLRLVLARLKDINEAGMWGEQRLIAVSRIDQSELRSIILQASEKEGKGAVCEVGAYLGPKHFWVSGTRRAVTLVWDMAKKAGARTAPVGDVAMHTALVRPRQGRFLAALDGATFHSPLHTVWINVTAEPARPGCDPAHIVAQLKEELTCPMLVSQVIDRMKADGVSEFYRAHLASSLVPMKPETSEDFPREWIGQNDPGEHKLPKD